MAKPKKKDKALGYITPVGRILRACILEPAPKDKYNDGKHFVVDMAWKKDHFRSDPDMQRIMRAVLNTGRAFFGDDELKLADFKNPFIDGDEADWSPVKGCFYVRCKSSYEIAVCGPTGGDDRWSEAQIKKIKPGDFGRMIVNPYAWDQDDGGVSLGVNVLQYSQPGKPLEGGSSKALKLFEEVAVDLSEIGYESAATDGEDEEDEDDQPEQKRKKPTAGKKRAAVSDDDEDDDTDSDSDDDDKPRNGKRRSNRSDDEAEDEDDDGEVLTSKSRVVKKERANGKAHSADILI